MINSVSSSTSGSSSTTTGSSKRITGLASGMDTETLVKDSTALTRSRLESAQQQEQLLEWKQDAYRTVINKLNDFNSKYFGSSYSSITYGDTMDTLTSKSSSTYVSVAPTSSAQPGNTYISDIISLASSAKVESSSMVTQPLTIRIEESNLSSLSGKSMNIVLDGITKNITFPSEDYSTYTTDNIRTQLQSLVDSAFGTGRISVSGSGDTILLDSPNSRLILNHSDTASQNISSVFDFKDGSANRLGIGISLSKLQLATPIANDETVSFSINGVSFNFSGNQSLTTVMNTVNSSTAGVKMSYSTITDKFTVTSSETGSTSNITFEDLNGGSFLQSILGTGVRTNGTDAVVKMSLNGSTDEASMITLTRSSNSFDVDGATYTLNGKADGNAQENVSINFSYDTDSIFDKIVSFVNDYNDVLGSMNNKVHETKYSDVLPLVDDDQKAKLTSSEIDTWTEKAKSGLLKNDTNLINIIASLRSSLYSTVDQPSSSDSIGLILSDIGITTGPYTTYGKLKIDETKLKSAIAASPETVLHLFTQKASIGYSPSLSDAQKKQRYNESGLLWRINDIVKNNLYSIGDSKGPLIQLAGSPNNDFLGKTTLSKEITDMNNKIDDLKKKLTDEEDHYWSQYTQMETQLSQLGSESSWLSSQFSS